MRPDRQEKWPLGIFPGLEPANRLLGTHHRTRSGRFSQRLAIADKIGGVHVMGRRIILSRHPVVVAMIVWLGLFLAIEFPIQMPFTNVTRIVALGLKQFSDRNFTGSQMVLATGWDPPPNPVSIRSPSSQNGRPGG